MFCQSCGQQSPDGTKFCPNCGFPTNQAAVPPVTQAPPMQYIQQPVYQQPIYAQPIPAAKPKKRKGCLIGAIIAFVLVVAVGIALIVGGGSLNFTTAKLANAAMASKIDTSTMKAITLSGTFSPQTEVIYVTAILQNAPSDTVITATWHYVTKNVEIATVDITSTETNQYISFSMSKPTNGFPTGDYKVDLYIDAKLAKTLEFNVK